MKQPSDSSERRRYVRLNSVFPVDFQTVDLASGQPLGPIQQGFTRNVSEGGICLEIHYPGAELIQRVTERSVTFRLKIHIPLFQKPADAKGTAAWSELRQEHDHQKLLVGIFYQEIDQKDRRRIVAYARKIKLLPRLAGLVGIILLGFSVLVWQYNCTLARRNAELVTRLLDSGQKRARLEEKLRGLEAGKTELTKESEESALRLKALEEQLRKLQQEELAGTQVQIAQIQQQLVAAREQNQVLQAKLAAIEAQRRALDEQVASVEKKRSDLQASTTQNLYRWVRAHQHAKTGLVLSFEGDATIKDYAFTYDQALAAQLFLLFKDAARARMILEFYSGRAVRTDGWFANAHDIRSGAVTEPTAHTGPNLWLGMAALRYIEQTNDTRFLPLAEQIAQTALQLQDSSSGGLRGGKEIRWFGTEHNLDGYAFFRMLYQHTKKSAYKKAADDILAWLVENAFSQVGSRIKRGRGDATIATDTYAWALAALGPQALLDSGMDPEQILAFAEEQCRVRVTYQRPDGNAIEITGFDFAKAQHSGRGGMVSSEWTAQMVIAFQIMGDFYMRLGNVQKAEAYLNKANYYVSQLDGMVICSPSAVGSGASCLPYATQGQADTGHGWRTPAGCHTGSLSGTVYTIFARLRFNPLQ